MRKYLVLAGAAVAAVAICGSAVQAQPYGPGMMNGNGQGYGPGYMMGQGQNQGYGPGYMRGQAQGQGQNQDEDQNQDQSQVQSQGPAQGYGPGNVPRGQGYAPGWMMGQGYGPGMMRGYGHGWMMNGYGRGPGMMYGPGAQAYASQGDLKLTIDQVKNYLAQMIRNPNLTVGEVQKKDADTIVANVVTKQGGSLVQKLDFNRHTGYVQPE